MSFNLKKVKQNDKIASLILQIQNFCIQNGNNLNELLYELKYPFKEFQSFFTNHYTQKIIERIGQETMLSILQSEGLKYFTLQEIFQYLNQNQFKQSNEIKAEYDSIRSKLKKNILESQSFQKLKQVSIFELYDQIESWNLLTYSLMKFLKNDRNDHSKENSAYPLLLNISHINFQNLKSLNLTQSNILSIQPLAWIRFPTLDSLFLCNNFIHSLQPFSKCLFQKLQRLALAKNEFVSPQFKNLSRMALKCRTANLIPSEQQQEINQKSFRYLKLSNDESNNNQIYSLTDVFKLQAAKIKIIQYKILGYSINYSIYTKIVQRFNCSKDYCFLHINGKQVNQ